VKLWTSSRHQRKCSHVAAVVPNGYESPNMIHHCLGGALLVWLVLAGSSVVEALSEDAPATVSEPQYVLTRFTAENGLPQNTVKALLQTRDGYLWIGTLNGLARFDGVRFKVFDHQNTPKMTHDSINALAEDGRSEDLWIGTGAGLLRYRSHGFQHFGPAQGVLGPVGILQPAGQGGVWFSSRAGQVGLARGDAIVTWDFAPAQVPYQVNQLAEESPTSLVVRLATLGTNLFHLDLKSKSFERWEIPEEAAGASFWRDNDGSFWLLGLGLWRQEGKAWSRVTTGLPGFVGSPKDLFRTADGQLWVVQNELRGNTLQRLVAGRLEPLASSEWPADLTITRLLEDREGNIWVGSTMGLFRLQPRRVRVYSVAEGLRDDNTLAVTAAPDGTVWVGAETCVSAIREGVVENLDPANPIPGQGGSAHLQVDDLNRLWASSASGLVRREGGHWQNVLSAEDLYDLGGVQSLYQDRAKRIWVGTKHGVLRQDGNRWTRFSVTNGLSSGDVRVIHQDARGDMWFGTFGGGLNRLRNGEFTTYATARGDHNNRAWWIHEDADGVFWVGTEDGLNRFVPPDAGSASRTAPADRFFTFTTEQGLLENTVNNIQGDGLGFLWLSGLQGIYRISRQQLNDVAAQKRSQVEGLAFGETDGMLSSECNGGDNQPAGCRDREGRIWFPTAKGVVVIDPKHVHRNEVPPPVVIEQVQADDQVVFGERGAQGRAVQGAPFGLSPAGKPAAGRSQALHGRSAPPSGLGTPASPLRLGPGRARVLEIHYTANTLSRGERARFRYRLDGRDSNWRTDDGNRRATFYTDLRPGPYTFRVIACNNHGVWNTQGAAFAFSIAPHFYETAPFYAFCGLMAVSAAFGFHHSRVRGINRLRRLEQQHALDLERARIARDIHDDLGSRFLQISVLGELSERNLPNPSQCRPCLEKLRATTSEAFQALDEIVWAANPRQDSVAGLVSYLREYVPQFLSPAGIQCRLVLPSPVPELPLGTEVRHHLFLAVKEALQNVVKHAQATEVTVRLELEERTLTLQVKDNGRGFDPGDAALTPPRSALGNGFGNMCERMARTGGRFAVRSAPGQGAEIILHVPL